MDNQGKSNNPPKKNFIKTLFSIDPQSKPSKPEEGDAENEIDKSLWVPDDQANTCFSCGKDFFGIILRRHHCRICGNVFCKDCCAKYIEIPGSNQERDIKVCEYCQSMHNKYEQLLAESLVDYKDSKSKATYETKLNDYYINNKKTTDEMRNFVGLKDDGTNEMIKKKINELFTLFAKKTIEKTLRSSPNAELYANWFEIISQLTIEIIQQLSPSFQDLKDSMDITDYIKIKTIPFVDQSLSRVIDGFAFQKNVCTKKMRTNIYNPKILLLDCGLEGKRNEEVQMPNILTQEPAYLEIIRKKIESVNPQVILVNKNASHKFQEDFSGSKMNISLVTNVKQSSLHKIARCTKTYVLPSADLIGKQVVLGQCYQFRIEKVKVPSVNKSNLFFKANEYNLMVFEGCGKLLHYTMILSGPKEEELKEVKRLLKEIILKTVRDLFLQQYLLLYFNADIFQVQEATVDAMILSPSERDFSYGFDTQILIKDNRAFEMVQVSLAKGTKGDAPAAKDYVIINHKEKGLSGSASVNVSNASILNSGTSFSINAIANDQNQPSINANESEILKSVYSVCGQASVVTMLFYSNNFIDEKPLGKIIIDLLQERDEKCKGCLRTFANHTSYLYKENGRIVISLISNTDFRMDEVLNYLSASLNFQFNKPSSADQLELFSYGYCSICKEIVTPLIKLPKEIFNFSATKFFKHILFNHNVKNFTGSREFNIKHLSSQQCEHLLFRDISRVFFSKIGAIRFSFEPQKVYGFNPHLQIENVSGLNKTSSELQAKLIKTRDFCFDILEMLKTQISQFNIDIKGMNESPSIQSPLQQITSINERLCQEINQLFQLVALFFHEKYDSELKINVSIKLIYRLIAQVKYMYNNISKLIRRMKVIGFLAQVKDQFIEQPRLTVGASVGNAEKEKAATLQAQMMEELTRKNEEFIKENETICSIDCNSNYQLLMSILKSHDNKHNLYSSDINEESLCGFISCLLTSDEYIDKINVGKIKLNEIQRIILNKKQECPIEEDLYQTSLLYDFSRIGFTYPGVAEDQIRLKLENILLSDDKEPFTFKVTFDLVDLLKTSFKEKLKSESINTSSKINCSELFVNLKKITSDLEAAALELKDIKRNSLGDFKPKFTFAKISFADEEKSELRYQMTAYYPRQFEAMRIYYCSSYEDFIMSIASFAPWEEVSGGKSKAKFFKSADSKYIIKCVNKIEFQMFIESGFHYYFHHLTKFLVHNMPSAMTKILGAYKIKARGKKKQKVYCIVMENLFYGLDEPGKQWDLKAYDLKGSKLNRYISKKNQRPNQVLLDTNFQEDFNGNPLALEAKLYTLVISAIQNDCTILSMMTVVDYSLLLIIIEDKENTSKKPAIKIGMLDYLRKYTWDKQLETVGKTIIHKFLAPTIVNPNDYMKRFVDKVCGYFIGV